MGMIWLIKDIDNIVMIIFDMKDWLYNVVNYEISEVFVFVFKCL